MNRAATTRCLLAGLAVCMFAACATLRQPLGSASWDGACYDGLRGDAEFLSGPDAYDCGLLHLDARDGAQTQIAACARDAVASGRPYRFGYQSLGTDTLYCDVAVRAPDGQLWTLYFDDEGTLGGHAVLSVRRCKDLRFERGTIGKGSFFASGGCADQDHSMFDVLAARRAAK